MGNVNWEAVSAISSILMTVATFAAIVASLWIANRASSARIKLSFSANNAVVSYLTGQVSDAFVAVTVENKSNRPIKVHSWFLEFKPSGQKAIILENSLCDRYTSLPATVDVEDSAMLQYGLLHFHDVVARAIKDGDQSRDMKLVFHVRYGGGKTKSVKSDLSAGELVQRIEAGELGRVLR